jgi:hypothetical protein
MHGVTTEEPGTSKQCDNIFERALPESNQQLSRYDHYKKLSSAKQSGLASGKHDIDSLSHVWFVWRKSTKPARDLTQHPSGNKKEFKDKITNHSDILNNYPAVRIAEKLRYLINNKRHL